MSDSKMSVQDEQELLRLLQIDSADIPGAGAGVNRDLKDPSHTAPRSQFFGVYNNTGNNADKFKFRAALRMGKPESPRWLNLGYFNCEVVAAMAYNVAAINTFGKGAWLNPVKAADANAEELKTWREKRAEHIETASTKLKTLIADGESMRYVDVHARSEEIAKTA